MEPWFTVPALSMFVVVVVVVLVVYAIVTEKR